MIFFTSCQNESIKCNGYLEKKTVISILKDEILKEKSTIKFSLGIDEEYLNKFFENNLKLSLIRTTAKDKELKSCECSAQLGLNLKQEIIDFSINSAKGTGNDLEYAKERISNMLNLKVDLDYTIQETSDENFIAETTVPYGDIGKLLTASFLFETNFNKKEFEIKAGKDYRYERGSEDCSYELRFMLSSNKNEIRGQYVQKCYFDKNPNVKKITGILKNGIITGNIEEKEFFEIKFNNSEMEYFMTKIVYEDGDIVTFENEEPIIYSLIK
jgi:hypothetical protein